MVADMLSATNSSTEIDFDRSIAIGPQHPNSSLLQSSQDLGVRMSEQVVAAARNDSDARMDGVEERRSGGAAAAVMGDFQDVRTQIALQQLRFRFALDVAGEQDARPLDLHAQNDRGVVLLRSAERVRDRVRFDADCAEVDRIAVADDVNRRCRRQQALRAIAGETSR